MIRIALAATAVALSVPAASQEATEMPGVADPTRVTAGTYAADPAHTLVGWEVSHFGFNPYFGSLGDVEGTLTIDPADLESAKVDVSLPITSLSLVSADLREHLLRPGKDGGDPDFFGPEPGEARFVSTRVVQRSDTQAYIYGDLTMNGATNPIAIAATFSGAGTNPMNQAETIGFTGVAVIKRSEYGVSAFIPVISDEVKLTISAAFEKQE